MRLKVLSHLFFFFNFVRYNYFRQNVRGIADSDETNFLVSEKVSGFSTVIAPSFFFYVNIGLHRDARIPGTALSGLLDFVRRRLIFVGIRYGTSSNSGA